jgi:hypothetical protein
VLRVKAKRGPTPAHTNYNSEQRGASIGRCNRVAPELQWLSESSHKA